MPNYNRVILAGHLTRDPVLRTLPGGTSVCDFGLAVNRRWRTQTGEQKEEVCFVDCSAFGKAADAIARYVTKGRALLVEGRLKFDQWTDKDNNKRSKHSVTVETFTFLDKSDKSELRDGVSNAVAEYEREHAPQPPSGDNIPF